MTTPLMRQGRNQSHKQRKKSTVEIEIVQPAPCKAACCFISRRSAPLQKPIIGIASGDCLYLPLAYMRSHLSFIPRHTKHKSISAKAVTRTIKSNTFQSEPKPNQPSAYTLSPHTQLNIRALDAKLLIPKPLSKRIKLSSWYLTHI